MWLYWVGYRPLSVTLGVLFPHLFFLIYRCAVLLRVREKTPISRCMIECLAKGCAGTGIGMVIINAYMDVFRHRICQWWPPICCRISNSQEQLDVGTFCFHTKVAVLSRSETCWCSSTCSSARTINVVWNMVVPLKDALKIYGISDQLMFIMFVDNHANILLSRASWNNTQFYPFAYVYSLFTYVLSHQT
jgi:hypothetical protein